MSERLPESATLSLAFSAGLVAAGVAVHGAIEAPIGTLPALALAGVGLFGVADFVSERTTGRLRVDAERAWLLAIAAAIPHGLVIAPADERAATMGEVLSGPILGPALEAVAGAAILCAVAITAVYGVARYGVHLGRPTPEERLLEDERRR